MQGTNKLSLLFDDTSFSFRSFVGLATIVGLVVLWNAPAVHTAPGMYPQDADINASVIGLSNDEFHWFDAAGKPSPETFMGLQQYDKAVPGYRELHVRLLVTGNGNYYTGTYRLIPTPGYRDEKVIGFDGIDQGQTYDILVSIPDTAKVLPPLKFQIQSGRGRLDNGWGIRGRNGQFDLPIKQIHDLGFGTQVIIRNYLQPGQLYSMDVMTSDGEMTHQQIGEVYSAGKNDETSLQARVNKWDITRFYLYASPAKTFTFSNIVVPPLPPKISNSGA